ncbi:MULTISPECIES: helix-turn-helix domain-containing protein [Anaerococcus]|uniref:helix-turn-helix domain-containing protein n=1 Tax=Anaerococcus TaxID=165779 RepID=UPI002151D86B|nr:MULTISPECIES: helix-turn-helix domain-containing protein [Anaerococcus]
MESIIKLLLFSNSFIKQQELADMYYVSHSQINKDIKQVRSILRTYNLSLISKPYYGIKIIGSEKNIRLALRNEIGEEPNLFRNGANEIYDVRKYDFRSNIDLFFALSLHLDHL